jgi:ferrous iron transport protein A
MTLDDAPVGQPVVVLPSPAGSAALEPGRPRRRGRARPVPSPAMARRLAELGFRAGATLSVLNRTSGHGAVVALGDDRVAVSRDILRAVPVAQAHEAVAHG